MATTTPTWYTTQTYPAWDIPLNTDVGADNITGVNLATFTMTFRNTSVNPPVDTLGTGVFTAKSLNPAEIYYKPSPTDVASAFTGVLVVKVDFPPSNSLADQAVYDPLPFVITVE